VIYELNHVGMRVADLAASVRFYTEVLGARVVDEMYIPAGRTDRVHVQIAGGLVEFLHPHEPPPDPVTDTRFGVDHVGFMTDDLDRDHARLLDAGFTFSVPPKVAGSGQGRLAFLTDPNGVRVELLQRKEELRVPTIQDGPARALAYVSLAAPDLPAAEAFYGGNLAMTPVSRTNGPGGTRSNFRHGDDHLELVGGPPQPGGRPIRGLAVRVDSVGSVGSVAGATEVCDPDGTRIELLEAV
jgi:catechol 2,3-dioxygenase-like lactoylglutathione lyase family enzyme